MEHFNIIQALCRSALAGPSNAVAHQVERLIKALAKDGPTKESKSLQALLSASEKSHDMAPSSIQRSFVLSGDLTLNTPVPVDKDSSTPLADIIFASELPSEPPIMNQGVKGAIESILSDWQNYNELSSIGAHPVRSCLMYGLPGTGKTQLAMWLAGKAGLPVVLARLDGLMSSLLGTSSKNIGNLFSFASRYNCVLLLDEFDAIAKLRNDSQEVGEIKRVVNTLLQCLDTRRRIGFTIGITNHEGLLDPAIWRRFDTQIHIPSPSTDVIPLVLRKFLAPMSLEPYQLAFLTWVSDGATGADIESLARWMKRSSVLDKGLDFISQVRRFSILNSERIPQQKRDLLIGNEEYLISAVLADPASGIKQREAGFLFGKSQSTISKLSKAYKHA